MRELYKGHRYELDHLDGKAKSVLQFVQRGPLHEACEGVTNQEVVRAIISRIKCLDSERPWSGNKDILYHLRMVILLHESRATEQKIERHSEEVEYYSLGVDGHFEVGQ